MSDTAKVWMSKFALTIGVKSVNVRIDDNGYAVFGGDKTFGYTVLSRSQWHRTEAEAIARAEQMRTAKIARLEKQIAKLRALKFEPTGGES